MGGRGEMEDVLGENFIWTCGALGNPLISGRDGKPKSKEDKTMLQVSRVARGRLLGLDLGYFP